MAEIASTIITDASTHRLLLKANCPTDASILSIHCCLFCVCFNGFCLKTVSSAGINVRVMVVANNIPTKVIIPNSRIERTLKTTNDMAPIAEVIPVIITAVEMPLRAFLRLFCYRRRLVLRNSGAPCVFRMNLKQQSLILE